MFKSITCVNTITVPLAVTYLCWLRPEILQDWNAQGFGRRADPEQRGQVTYWLRTNSLPARKQSCHRHSSLGSAEGQWESMCFAALLQGGKGGLLCPGYEGKGGNPKFLLDPFAWTTSPVKTRWEVEVEQRRKGQELWEDRLKQAGP